MEKDDLQSNANSNLDEMQPTIISRTSESSWLQCVLALSMVAGSIHLNMLLIILGLILLPSVWAFLVFGLLLTLILIPVEQNSNWGQRLAKFVCYHGSRYFPITVIVENMKAFNPSNAYVFAFEPHSVIPVGLLALCNHSGFMPLPNIKALASSVVFYTPILRHLWSWLGVVPASRENFVKLLNAGYSCVVIPGGVQEILYMEHGHEVAFLKNRRGFIHVSMETGCPLVPVFCFGQTDLYHWWKPRGQFFNVLCRVIKFTPLLFWGTFGSPIPFCHPLHIVVGTPIAVERKLKPSKEEVDEVHARFVLALLGLFERHKAAAGYKDTSLSVY